MARPSQWLVVHLLAPVAIAAVFPGCDRIRFSRPLVVCTCLRCRLHHCRSRHATFLATVSPTTVRTRRAISIFDRTPVLLHLPPNTALEPTTQTVAVLSMLR